VPKKLILTCKYCKYWHNSSKRSVDVYGKYNTQTRKCKVKNDYVGEKDVACDKFVLAEFIFCDRDSNWMKVEVCINRVKTKVCSKSCKHYKVIKETFNG
jgi:hypothetical protein